MKSVFPVSTSPQRRPRITPSERRRWVAAWESSNQTQEEFARVHGLKVWTLRNWIRQGARAAAPLPAKVDLKEFKLDEILGAELLSSSAAWEVEIRLPGGIAVAVGRQAPAERIRQIVEALRC